MDDPRRSAKRTPASGTTTQISLSPAWGFTQKTDGMWIATLSGGTRTFQLHLYPAEFDALLRAAGYETWRRDVSGEREDPKTC